MLAYEQEQKKMCFVLVLFTNNGWLYLSLKFEIGENRKTKIENLNERRERAQKTNLNSN